MCGSGAARVYHLASFPSAAFVGPPCTRNGCWQGDSTGLWPRNAKRNVGAGLTYPPGVKPSFAKGQLKGRWPVMAAAAAADLSRVDCWESPAVGSVSAKAVKDSQEGAAAFLLSISIGGLLQARDG